MNLFFSLTLQGACRLLQLSLSDGHLRYKAIEFAACPQLKLEGSRVSSTLICVANILRKIRSHRRLQHPPGTKIVLTGSIRVRAGIILLSKVGECFRRCVLCVCVCGVGWIVGVKF